MTLKDVTISKLGKLSDGSYVLNKPEDFKKNFQEQNLLDFETDGTYSVTKMNAISMADRLKQRVAMGNSKQEDLSEKEVNIDAQVDRFQIKEDLLETSVAKAFNQVVNDQQYEDMSYMIVKLTIGVTKTDSNILQLLCPDMLRNHKHLIKREKPEFQDNLLIKRVGPFLYEFSVTIPVNNGNGNFEDLDSLNHIIDYIDQLMAWTLEKTYKHLPSTVDKNVVARHTLALSNRGRIRTYLINKFREFEDLDDFEVRDKADAKLEEIWDELGVKPLTDARLDVNLQVLKIHRSNDPHAFTSARRNVSIMKSNEGSVKIERTSYTVDRSVPYMEQFEDELAKNLLELSKFFTIWAENQARYSLGLEKYRDLNSLKNLYPTNKKTLTVLGFSNEQAVELSNMVSKIITDKMAEKGKSIEMDALTKNIK